MPLSRRPQSPQPPKGPSQRQLRVAEEIRHLLAGYLIRGELRDPALVGAPVTVTEVRISPDLKLATAYCVPLGGVNAAEVLAGLNRCKGFLRGQIGRQIALRYTPDLLFTADTSFDEVRRIDELLRSEKVRRDLEVAADDADAAEE